MFHKVPRGTTGVSSQLINETPKFSFSISPVCNATLGYIDLVSQKQVEAYVDTDTI